MKSLHSLRNRPRLDVLGVYEPRPRRSSSDVGRLWSCGIRGTLASACVDADARLGTRVNSIDRHRLQRKRECGGRLRAVASVHRHQLSLFCHSCSGGPDERVVEVRLADSSSEGEPGAGLMSSETVRQVNWTSTSQEANGEEVVSLLLINETGLIHVALVRRSLCKRTPPLVSPPLSPPLSTQSRRHHRALFRLRLAPRLGVLVWWVSLCRCCGNES